MAVGPLEHVRRLDQPDADDRLWPEIAAILDETYRRTAPRRLIARLAPEESDF